jgi:hypothetical protein
MCLRRRGRDRLLGMRDRLSVVRDPRAVTSAPQVVTSAPQVVISEPLSGMRDPPRACKRSLTALSALRMTLMEPSETGRRRRRRL